MELRAMLTNVTMAVLLNNMTLAMQEQVAMTSGGNVAWHWQWQCKNEGNVERLVTHLSTESTCTSIFCISLSEYAWSKIPKLLSKHHLEFYEQTCDVNKVLDFWCIDLLIP